MASQSVQLDSVPQATSNVWKPSAGIDLDEFLKMNKPSTTRGQDGWIWILADPSGPREGAADEDQANALADCKTIFDVIESEAKRIQEDPAIPIRGSAKKGIKSKKDRREELIASFAEDIEKIARKAGLVCGKWLFFEDPKRVDNVFATLAHSIVSGPLSRLAKETGVRIHTLKAADVDGIYTSVREDSQPQHVVNLYFENAFEEKDAVAVLKVLLGEHGLSPSSVKPDVYTHIGLDSTNPMKMRSSKFTVKELLTLEQIEELREASKLKQPNTHVAKVVAAPAKRKAGDEDAGFEKFSDEDDDAVEHGASTSKSPAKENGSKATPPLTATKAPSKIYSSSPAKKTKEAQSESETEEESDDEAPPPPKAAPVSIASSSTKRAPPAKKPRF